MTSFHLLISNQEIKTEIRMDFFCTCIALAGYTNAGKSSLMNALCGDDHARVQDELFHTLDPLTRRLNLPSGAGHIVASFRYGWIYSKVTDATRGCFSSDFRGSRGGKFSLTCHRYFERISHGTNGSGG